MLGSAAGGGFPQWNCGCRQCSLARTGDSRVRPATQASVAVTGNGENWLLIGASPDLRQQISQSPHLWPRTPTRDSPITDVLLIGGDIDAIAGLLVLRERQPFTVYAPVELLDLLATNRVFDVLDPTMVRRVAIRPMEPFTCAGNLTVTLLTMPGKVPLFLENNRNAAAEPESAATYAAQIQTAGRIVIVAPACADITEPVRTQLSQADVLFFDGTLFTDTEMIAAGLGSKTGRRMGHTPISGPDGTLTRLADLPGRRIFLHINNTNPILVNDSPERRAVEAAGFEVAYDGMEIDL
ncbi:pyrroloquinoline quinone biosynthesis protein PqqB [Acidisphaera sp. S103]|uniref:pyrroloquinoline quinone biosynthesis protein PqqB n=1 Tax=Acidisphaera sp. S103 TaxID=1747223 RepID=UPI00131A9BDE|nr:pyrroloquinoline quinone biosynthesis protein PqqB [Acidisphaera sp. S103]